MDHNKLVMAAFRIIIKWFEAENPDGEATVVQLTRLNKPDIKITIERITK